MRVPVLRPSSPPFRLGFTNDGSTASKQARRQRHRRPGYLMLTHREAIISSARRHRLPDVYPYRVMASEGGLAVYGPEISDLYRRAASYVDRILKGEKPGDLPVQQPTKFQLTVNLKTAKSLGLAVPQSVLAR